MEKEPGWEDLEKFRKASEEVHGSAVHKVGGGEESSDNSSIGDGIVSAADTGDNLYTEESRKEKSEGKTNSGY